MPIIKFINEKKEIQVPEGSNLRSEAMRAGVGLYPGIHQIPIVGHCPGLGCCGTCRVLITKGMDNVSPMGAVESVRLKKMSLAFIGNEDTMRLACQTLVKGDIEVQTKPPLNLFGENFFS
jgi:ferredoxin